MIVFEVGPSQWAQDVVHMLIALANGVNTVMIGYLIHRRRKADRRTQTHWGATGMCQRCMLEVAEQERRTKGER